MSEVRVVVVKALKTSLTSLTLIPCLPFVLIAATIRVVNCIISNCCYFIIWLFGEVETILTYPARKYLKFIWKWYRAKKKVEELSEGE